MTQTHDKLKDYLLKNIKNCNKKNDELPEYRIKKKNKRNKS